MHFLLFFVFIGLPKLSLAEDKFKVTQPAPNIVNIEHKDSLKLTSKLNCLSESEIKTNYTPIDLFESFKKCVDSKRYDDAVFLYLLANAYGSFDKLRVEDKSAHQALAVYRINNLDNMSPEKAKPFNEAFDRVRQSPNFKKETCIKIKKIGAPSYYPKYMTAHGISNFTGGKAKGLLANFNTKDGWDKTLESGLSCSQIK